LNHQGELKENPSEYSSNLGKQALKGWRGLRGNEKFAGRSLCLVVSGPTPKRGCQGATAHQVAREGGQTGQIGRWGGDGKTLIPRPALHLQENKQEQTLCPAAPRRTLAESSWAPSPGGAPADAILKAKMAAPRKPAPRSQ
jgi:hypothetical protein